MSSSLAWPLTLHNVESDPQVQSRVHESSQGGGHSSRSCTCTRNRGQNFGQNFGQVAKVENLSSQRVKANFQLVKMIKIGPKVDFSGCGLISFEGQGQLLGVVKRSRPKIGGQES